jgi:trehalose-6-phosphate hydrolase
MQGTPYIYQGEEIGMTNPHFSTIGEYRDVESHNMYNELRDQGRDADELLAILASKSRDNSRTPMQWNAEEYGGFTTGTPWINLADNVAEVNAHAALNDPDSVFYAYQKLIALRKEEPLLTWGNYQDLLPEHPSLWCYRREWQGQTLLVVANLSRDEQHCGLEAMDGEWEVAISNYPQPQNKPGAITLRPFEAVWWIQKA